MYYQKKPDWLATMPRYDLFVRFSNYKYKLVMVLSHSTGSEVDLERVVLSQASTAGVVNSVQFSDHPRPICSSKLTYKIIRNFKLEGGAACFSVFILASIYIIDPLG